jgi:hypothetical protein
MRSCVDLEPLEWPRQEGDRLREIRTMKPAQLFAEFELQHDDTAAILEGGIEPNFFFMDQARKEWRNVQADVNEQLFYLARHAVSVGEL